MNIPYITMWVYEMHLPKSGIPSILNILGLLIRNISHKKLYFCCCNWMKLAMKYSALTWHKHRQRSQPHHKRFTEKKTKKFSLPIRYWCDKIWIFLNLERFSNCITMSCGYRQYLQINCNLSVYGQNTSTEIRQ